MDSTWMDFERFVQHFNYKPVKEFEPDSSAATWAPSTNGKPKTWGEEDARIALPAIDPQQEFTLGSAAAVSFDERFVAVASNALIKVYEIASLRETATIIVNQESVATLSTTPWCGANIVSNGSSQASLEPAYTLLIQGCEDSGAGGRIFIWALDCHGRLLDVALSHQIERNASVNAIEAFVGIEDQITNNTHQRTRPLIIIDGDLRCRSPDFFDSSETKVVYIEESSSAATEVVIFSLATNGELCRLQGHSENVMWAGWSPDAQMVATASWDQTCKLWDSKTGQCQHTIGPTGGQNWHGEFSPDGKYVCFTSGNGKATVYSTTDGRELARFDLQRPRAAVRWSPRDAELAVDGGMSVRLWRPLEDSSNKILQLEENGCMLDDFCQINLEWLNGGDRLIMKVNDNTIILWDRRQNVKWRFQKSTTLSLTETSNAMFYLASTDTLASLDCDRVVRFWKL